MIFLIQLNTAKNLKVFALFFTVWVFLLQNAAKNMIIVMMNADTMTGERRKL